MPRRPGARARIEPAALPRVWLARDRPSEVISANLRAGRWERTSRGVYTAVPTTADESPFAAAERRALAQIAGIDRRLTSAHWFSHVSAALIWGLPVWRVPTTTHILATRAAGSTRTPTVTTHTGRLVDEDLVEASGLPVTSLGRTVADCLATLPPLEGLVIADGALHRGLDPDELEAAVHARTARNGSARARAVMSVADGGAESPGESATRYVVVRDGFPLPTTQIPVVTHLGEYWSDLGWEEWLLLMEYDGELKYTSRADLVDEKRRHDALVETGRRVLRVTRRDLTGLTARLLPHVPDSIRLSLRPRRELFG